MSVEDETFMRRAIALAMRGRGAVEPNPMVGCLIVSEGRVIGEGWHRRYGGPHAEPNALASCSDSPRGATAYVTLEPCCHLNKQTPPCTPQLIEAGIARVVAGCQDPGPDVSGRGFELLRKAGVEVNDGVLLDECRQLLAPFAAYLLADHPYVTLKWAEAADGKVAGPGGQRLQLSGPVAQRVVHELRSRCDVIAVGIGTVLADDPLLTARDVPSVRTPVRVVFDTEARLPATSRLVRTARETPLALFSSTGSRRAVNLIQFGVHTYCVPRLGKHLDLDYALKEVRSTFKATHILVEAGPTLARAFLEMKYVDRIWRIQSPMVVGDATAPAAPSIPPDAVEVGRCQLGNDTLIEYLMTSSATFAAPVPSADFRLVSNATSASPAGYNPIT